MSDTTISILRAIATIAPAIYTGFTFAYTHVAMPPLTTHAPPKLLAKQWFQAYEFAPAYVGPMILLGASSNALLACFTSSSSSIIAKGLYIVAAGAMASVVPYTMLYMESGVNGAGKCKVQELLREEGFLLKAKGKGKVTDWDSASERARRWAETVDMKVIVQTWARTNAWRYIISGVATVLSAAATVFV
ncbi:repeatdomain containing protein [Pyrenophora tritici-repentis]|uniref:DUF1772 domain containing protein n=2 Tax=Pyrenophora tritici-repentis TaxID=45151 RepID=A0A2W1GGR2_9PLEO|nr:uncharacterized protein PTRG_00810 [Pyrenophora tritici-repentis Pt-1C-BFP]KAA8625436.1 DUF1772 domain-containing protein [Pyrenophora tritici-repentis]EDU40248.1 predicted protein [Pyrenophora tritici-repentis Pt-1C-BFP]KAF7453836.1 DUF1772 domain containing protein [Pyrenophora tritici-repentis]KAF7576929.1 DUF1772 domain containing protein [Pyrenophora tritici-repentis]KAG9387597.1 DUF1772 domain containing protein [Pyrenophora tritici-repentis]